MSGTPDADDPALSHLTCASAASSSPLSRPGAHTTNEPMGAAAPDRCSSGQRKIVSVLMSVEPVVTRRSLAAESF